MFAGRFWGGMALIILGMIFLLNSADIIPFRELFVTYWPLLLILLGVSLLLRRPRFVGTWSPGEFHGARSFGDTSAEVASETLGFSTVFGDTNLKVTSKNLKGGRVSTVFGDIVLDLTGAVLAEGEQTLKVSGVFGDLSIRVPTGMAFAVGLTAAFGSVRVNEQRRQGLSSALQYESPGYASAPRRLKIEASQVFGDIDIGPAA